MQTLFLAREQWGLSVEQIAEEYELSVGVVANTLAFAEKHRQEIEMYVAQDEAEEPHHV